MTRRFFFLLLCSAALLNVPWALAQQSQRFSADAQAERVALHQSLLDLSNPWTVMCVAAHPDDEDGATLTVLRRKYGVHTVTVFSTYGEGGQNAIGPELYEELGAIRARETLAAAEIQGSEAWFLALRDFGFSKSAEEAFRIWGHDAALSRLVLKIRTLRPDVIITNHDEKSGHGHHQATGRLVLEAFEAAADARRFPEQLREPGVRPWQVQRVFVRVNYESGTGSRALEEEAERAGKIITINPNERDPVRSTTYAEQALQALHRHASQGPWPDAVPKDGAPLIRYRLAREAPSAVPLPAHAQTFLDELRLPADLAAPLAAMIENRSLVDLAAQLASEPQRIFDAINATRKERDAVRGAPENSEQPHLRLMKERLQSALAASSGIKATLTPQASVVVPGTDAAFSLTISNTGRMAATIKGVRIYSWQKSRNVQFPALLAPGGIVKQGFVIRVPKNAEVNLPRAAHLYDGRVFGQQVRALIDVSIKDESFPLQASAQLDVAPGVEVAGISPSPFVLTPGNINRPKNFSLRLVNHLRAPLAGRIRFGNASRSHNFSNIAFNLGPSEARNIGLKFPDNAFGKFANDAMQAAPAAPKSLPFMIYTTRSAEPIAQGALPVVYSDARVAPNLRVGYIRSFDDTLRDALAALGVEAVELKIDDVRAGDLGRYDTIIVDNRGYQAHAELVALNSRLLEYVRAGGTLIVFYHKANEWNPDSQKKRGQLAPYPITLGNARVTNEAAPVAFAEAESALLNFPNKIAPEDFDNWIQERGLYYPKEWDARYSAPLSTNDEGEAPLRGGLLAADYGRGRYIYTSMVWYRQLRAGVPGAYRLFANMISYGRAGAKRNTASR